MSRWLRQTRRRRRGRPSKELVHNDREYATRREGEAKEGRRRRGRERGREGRRGGKKKEGGRGREGRREKENFGGLSLSTLIGFLEVLSLNQGWATHNQ